MLVLYMIAPTLELNHNIAKTFAQALLAVPTV